MFDLEFWGLFLRATTEHLKVSVYTPSPVVRQLQRHLDEGVRTHLVLFGKLLAEPLEVEHVHVEIVDQSVASLKHFNSCVSPLILPISYDVGV